MTRWHNVYLLDSGITYIMVHGWETREEAQRLAHGTLKENPNMSLIYRVKVTYK